MCHNNNIDLSVAETLNSNKKSLTPKTYKLLNINTKKETIRMQKTTHSITRVVFFIFFIKILFCRKMFIIQ